MLKLSDPDLAKLRLDAFRLAREIRPGYSEKLMENFAEEIAAFALNPPDAPQAD